MSREHGYTAPRSPLPPPPRPHPSHSAPASPPLLGPGTPHQISPLRRIAVQPPLIITSLSPASQGTSFSHTPASTTSLSLPFSPYAPSPSTYASTPLSSPMTIRNPSSVPYNPQQWGRQGPTGGVHIPHSANPSVAARGIEVTGMEGQQFFYIEILCQYSLFQIDRECALHVANKIVGMATCSGSSAKSLISRDAFSPTAILARNNLKPVANRWSISPAISTSVLLIPQYPSQRTSD